MTKDQVWFLSRFLGGPEEFLVVARHVIGLTDDEARGTLVNEMTGILKAQYRCWISAETLQQQQAFVSDAAEQCAWALYNAHRNITAADRRVLERWVGHHFETAANHPDGAQECGGDLGPVFIRHGSARRRVREGTAKYEGTAEYYEAQAERARAARVAFMNRAVRRGRPFSVKQIATALGIDEVEAAHRKRSAILSDAQIAKIMGVTEREVEELKSDNPPPALLNVLARTTGYVDRVLHEVWEPNSELPNGFVGAAASRGRGHIRHVNDKRLGLTRKFELIALKDTKSRRKEEGGGEGVV